MSDAPKCEACGKRWAKHLGIMGTCAQNADLRAELSKANEHMDRDYKTLQFAGNEIARLEAEVKQLNGHMARALKLVGGLRVEGQPAKTGSNRRARSGAPHLGSAPAMT